MTYAKRLLVCLMAIMLLISTGTAFAEDTPQPEETPLLTETPQPEATKTPLVMASTTLAAAEIAGTITNDCQFTLPERVQDKAYRFLDAYVESYLPLLKGEELLAEMPGPAKGLYLEWYGPNPAYSIEEISAAGNVINTHGAPAFVNAYFELHEDTRALRIIAEDDCQLSTLRLYAAEGALPDDVQRWQPPHERADLVFLAATPEAALEDLFAALSIYTVEHEVQTALVCMSIDTRAAQNDLLAALWKLGIENYPYFGGFFTWNDQSYTLLNAEWKAASVQKYLESILTSLTPRVLVTHADDQDAVNQAKYFTAEQLLTLAGKKKTLLSDIGLEKLYLAAAEGTTLDLDAPLFSLGGATARQAVEEIAFSQYQTLQIRPAGIAMQARGTFALSYSNVGEDLANNDLLENIGLETLSSYVIPTPTPEPTPEPTDTPAPTATPAPVETPLEEDGAAQALSGIPLYFWALPAGGLLLSIILFLLLFRKPLRRRQLPGRVIASLLPLLIGLIALALLWRWPSLLPFAAAPTPTPTLTLAPSPTPEPRPEPEAAAEAEEPAETPEPAGEVQQDADAAYYRQPDDPAEVIVIDPDNGYWAYKTDELSIIINRFVTDYTTQANKTFQNVYFVAEIRMRDVNAFRTGQAGERHNGLGAVHPYIIARRERGVLLITGDNLLVNDKEVKGIMIRGGKFIADYRAADTMAMYPDMSMRIFRVGEIKAEELQADGVYDAISFGPTLMRNGVLQEGVDRFRDLGDERNPRVGLGMVEPGHFVAIVVDGRQHIDNYSYGMSLSRFAELFVDYGCVEVYNMDGGVSAAMVFMGEQINRHADRTDVTTSGYTQSFQRRIPDGLIWGYSDQVPTMDDPVYNKGTNKGGQNLLPSPQP